MSKLEPNKILKNINNNYKEQYANWIRYLTRDKYKPTFRNLEAVGFVHPELLSLKESLNQRGCTQEEINEYELTDVNLIHMGVTETMLRYRFLNKTELMRLSLAKYFYKLEVEQGYKLFQLSITYKPQQYELATERVDSCFIKFHTQFLLPKSLGTRNIHLSKNKKIQPIVFAFLDEHDPIKGKFTGGEAPIRLHHHAIYAVHPDAVTWFDEHIGENTFSILNQDLTPYLSSDLTDCGAMRVLYASKMLETYPDFLMFPDKWKRCNEKYTNTSPSNPLLPKVKEAEELFLNFERRTFPCQRRDSYVTPQDSPA
jgi:hypothetical protein